MIDIDTHKVVDLIESREAEDVREWLKTYPNITIVSRDGSTIYKSAISQSNASIIQISDRFHLLKGLTEAAKTYITGYLSPKFAISRTAPSAETNSSYYWKKDSREDFPTKKHNGNLAKKKKLVEDVRKLNSKGYTNVSIARKLGINNITVAKYINPEFNPVNTTYNTTYPSKIKPFADDIINMIQEGVKFKNIERNIREKGYDGAASTIRMFATRERKILKEANIESFNKADKIERKWLISLLYNPLEKVKSITPEQLNQIIDEHPVIGRIYDIVRTFKETLFAKKPDDLYHWIQDAVQLHIDPIDSFISGITRDIEAVQNAIRYDYSNGLAEGSVNKLKLIKRIMYGRNSFTLLKAKLLRHNS